MDKNTYIIWKFEKHGNIADARDVVGLFVGTYEEADALVEKMNQEDPTVKEGVFKKWLYGYFKSEPSVITKDNYKEFIND